MIYYNVIFNILYFIAYMAYSVFATISHSLTPSNGGLAGVRASEFLTGWQFAQGKQWEAVHTFIDSPVDKPVEL